MFHSIVECDDGEVVPAGTVAVRFVTIAVGDGDESWIMMMARY